MTDSQKLDLLLSGMQEMKQDVHLLKDDVWTLNQEVDIIKYQVTYLSLTLENDIRPSIQRVAEGHLDLSRNLHEAMKPCLETEMLSLKVHMLEINMRDVKAKLA